MEKKRFQNIPRIFGFSDLGVSTARVGSQYSLLYVLPSAHTRTQASHADHALQRSIHELAAAGESYNSAQQSLALSELSTSYH
eukprot:1604303-Amphidinium_carterae.1